MSGHGIIKGENITYSYIQQISRITICKKTNIQMRIKIPTISDLISIIPIKLQSQIHFRRIDKSTHQITSSSVDEAE